MSTHLLLHHVGEVLLAALLGRLSPGAWPKVPCHRHDIGCSLQSIANQSGLDVSRKFASNVQLASSQIGDADVGFDGGHGIDILCHDGKRGLAMEAKLGLDRMSKGEFTRRFLWEVSFTSHRPRRVKGSMTALLNHRSIHDSGVLTLRTEMPTVAEIAQPWILIIRRTVFAKWKMDLPPLSENAHILIFEDLVKMYGDASAFDQLVRETIGDGFYEAWGLNV